MLNTQVNKVNKIVSVKTEIDIMSATGEVRMDNFNKIESLNGTLMFEKKPPFSQDGNGFEAIFP